MQRETLLKESHVAEGGVWLRHNPPFLYYCQVLDVAENGWATADPSANRRPHAVGARKHISKLKASHFAYWPHKSRGLVKSPMNCQFGLARCCYLLPAVPHISELRSRVTAITRSWAVGRRAGSQQPRPLSWLGTYSPTVQFVKTGVPYSCPAAS